MGCFLTAVAPDALDLAINSAAADALFREAHTAHAFTDQEVSDAQREAIYDLMKMAPTAMNSQPLRITWVASPQARQLLGEHMNDGNRSKTLAAPMVAILSVDPHWYRHIGLTAPHALSQQEFFASNLEAALAMGEKSAWIAVGYFILAARAVGLDCGPMTGFDARAVDAEFHGETGFKALAVVNLGHATPEGIRPRNGRLDIAEATVTV